MEPYNPYMDLTDGEDFYFKGWKRIYDETFLSYYKLLVERSNHLQSLQKDSLDYKTYTDICLVMIRAILIESERLTDNYTLQNFLKRHNQLDSIQEVNKLLNENINKRTTLKEALKICVDKFIVHYDSLVTLEISEHNSSHMNDTISENEYTLLHEICFKRNLFLMDLRNDTYPYQIKNIVLFITKMVEKTSLAHNIEPNSTAYGL